MLLVVLLSSASNRFLVTSRPSALQHPSLTTKSKQLQQHDRRVYPPGGRFPLPPARREGQESHADCIDPHEARGHGVHGAARNKTRGGIRNVGERLSIFDNVHGKIDEP